MKHYDNEHGNTLPLRAAKLTSALLLIVIVTIIFKLYKDTKYDTFSWLCFTPLMTFRHCIWWMNIMIQGVTLQTIALFLVVIVTTIKTLNSIKIGDMVHCYDYA